MASYSPPISALSAIDLNSLIVNLPNDMLLLCQVGCLSTRFRLAVLNVNVQRLDIGYFEQIHFSPDSLKQRFAKDTQLQAVTKPFSAGHYAFTIRKSSHRFVLSFYPK